jgi:hypothetical protein
VEATRELLSLTLDENGAATAFVQKFTQCVSDLKKTDSALPTDNITLRAIIINAIKSPDYETALSEILNQPNDTWQAALRRLRLKETQNSVRFGGDSDSGRTIQRRQQVGKVKGMQKGSPYARSPQDTAPHKPTEIPNGGIFFPPYPKSVAKLMNDNTYKALASWRSMVLNATPGTTLKALYDKFDLSIQSVDQQMGRSRPNQRGSSASSSVKSQKPHKRARRTIKVEEGQEDTKPSATDQHSGSESESEEQQQRPPLSFQFVPRNKRKQRRLSLSTGQNSEELPLQQQYTQPSDVQSSETVDFASSEPFSGVKHIKLRHISTSEPNQLHNGILDNGADQVMLSIHIVTVHARSGQYLEVDGPLSGRASQSQCMELCSLDTLMEFEDGTKVLARYHQALLDSSPDQTESLLQPYQMTAHGVRMCLLPREAQRPNGEPGEQCLVHPNTLVHHPFFFDGLCYVRLSKPSDQDYASYPSQK